MKGKDKRRLRVGKKVKEKGELQEKNEVVEGKGKRREGVVQRKIIKRKVKDGMKEKMYKEEKKDKRKG